ncbi:MAG: hypothetical protein AVDCRST_MAG41-3600, partial [uncultured Corynebacteriales bacterium]
WLLPPLTTATAPCGGCRWSPRGLPPERSSRPAGWRRRSRARRLPRRRPRRRRPSPPRPPRRRRRRAPP